MSVIQKIRNKYIGLVVVLIVLALIGFLVMDAMQSNVRGLFTSDQTLLAKVNGKRIEYKDFDALRAKYEDNLKAQSKDGSISDEQRTQIPEQVYNDMLNEQLMKDEMEKLGIEVSDKEYQDMLTGTYADPMVKQNFTDPNTGIFDPNKVTQYINSLKQDKEGKQKAQWKEFEEALLKNRLNTKYLDLYKKGIYVPRFVIEDMMKQQGSKSSVAFVNIPYTTVSDSAVKVSDDDIKKYIDKNAHLMKSEEAMAKIDYVAFDIVPSSADTAAVLGVLNTLKNELATTTDVEAFTATNSEEAYSDKYFNATTLDMPNAAEVINAPVGAIFGPVFQNGSYKIAKVLAKKSMPDSVKASHILISINEQRSEEQAKASIDSIENMVKAGAPFDQLAAQRSDDQGSAKKSGDLGYFAQGMMVKEFNDFCFSGSTGGMKVVKTQFGYHLIKITDQKMFNPSAQVAIISKELQAGDATRQAALNKANDFIAKAKDEKSFDATAKAMGKDKRVADNITKTQASIQGLGSARDLSRWAFDAKIGAVSPMYTLDNKCVIATLVSRTEKGSLPTVEALRPQLEAILKKEKKGKLIADKYKGKSLQDIATATAGMVKNADTVLLVGGGNQEIGFEPKVIGASFNKNNVNKVSEGIIGDQGVYFLTVKNITDAPKQTVPVNSMEARQMEMQMTQNINQYLQYILKKKATIEDNRANFF